MKKTFLSLVLTALTGLSVQAQTSDSIPDRPTTGKRLLYSNRFSILAGLMQPIALKGANVEINYFTNRMSFDYSHGISLDPPSAGDYKSQGLALHLPYSTGFGIGYRFTSFFDVRIEPKLHRWEVYTADAPQTAGNRLGSFHTVTIGAGAYYRYMPFRNSTSVLLQGITSSISIRYWPNIASSRSNDKMTYFNRESNQQETINVPRIGIANTPVVFNIAVGYTKGGK